MGDEVNKVGYKTGWTYGNVTGTCKTKLFTNLADGSHFTAVCYDEASAGVDFGDSGSAAFYWTGGTDVTVTGQLFGMNADNGTFAFSPMNFINGDPSVGYLKVTIN